MYVCICKGVTDRDIRAAVEEGAAEVGDLSQELGVGTGCGQCKGCAREVLNDALLESASRIGHAA